MSSLPRRWRSHRSSGAPGVVDGNRPARPLVLAHRGASAAVLENTIGAFRRARSDGADGVELDVMRCGSGEVIVFHDDDLARLGSTGDGRRVRSLPLDAIRAVRLDGAGDRALAPSTGRGDDDRIPTLAEVLEETGDLLVNVELKSPERSGLAQAAALVDDGLAAATAGVLRRAGRLERFLVSSFDPFQLARFRAAAPEIPTGFLFHRGQPAPLERAWAASLLHAFAVHPEATLVDARAVAGWHAAGRAVHVWTVDDARELALLRTLGVDGVITNRPAAAIAALASAGARPAAGS